MLERVYNINLRRKVVKTPKNERSPNTIRQLRNYITKHMKSDNVKINREINELIWSRGIKNPVLKLKVKAVKDDAGKVSVSLVKE